MLVAAQIQAGLLPVYQPASGPDPLHDLLVEVERGQLVSVQVRTLAMRKDRPTYEGSVVMPDELSSSVFAFVALELGVCFIVPTQDIRVARRVSWQPPMLRSRSRMRGAFDLDPYFMALDRLWTGVDPHTRFAWRWPLLEEIRRRSHRLVYGE
jgi:hypothetical protein